MKGLRAGGGAGCPLPFSRPPTKKAVGSDAPAHNCLGCDRSAARAAGRSAGGGRGLRRPAGRAAGRSAAHFRLGLRPLGWESCLAFASPHPLGRPPCTPRRPPTLPTASATTLSLGWSETGMGPTPWTGRTFLEVSPGESSDRQQERPAGRPALQPRQLTWSPMAWLQSCHFLLGPAGCFP